MNAWKNLLAVVAVLVASFGFVACSDDADELGVGAECTSTENCDSGDEEIKLTCLTVFKGGYCGIEGCTKNADCPENSICVTHDDAKNYCFRTCAEKTECNANRGAEVESNCSSSITRVETGSEKACVPSSGN